MRSPIHHFFILLRYKFLKTKKKIFVVKKKMPNFKKLITEFFYYQTAKVVEIKNPWLGLLFYSIQLIILV